MRHLSRNPRVCTAVLLVLAALGRPARLDAQTEPAAELPRGDKFALAHDLTKGATFGYKLVVEAKLTFAEAEQDSTMRFALHFDAQVVEVDQGLASVTHRLRRIEAHTDSPFAKTDYDSAEAKADPGTFRQLAQLIEKQFVVRVDAAGHIDSVELPEQMPRGAEQVAGADFESLFELYFVPLPSKPVALDEPWDSSVKLIDTGIQTGNSARVTNTLKSVTDGQAKIDRKYLLRAPKRHGVEFQVLKSEGTATLDIATGRIIETTMLLEARARRTMGEGKVSEGTSKVTVKVTREPVEQPAPSKGR